MSYFIFLKNSEGKEGTIYRIAENQSDFNALNIIDSDYKIIEDSQENFNFVKLNNKFPLSYNNNNIVYTNITNEIWPTKLKKIIEDNTTVIKAFLDNNLPSHPLFNQWNDYYNQLNNLNLDSITYPLNKSLEQYFFDLGQPSLNILQLP
jgi:hypothetical protein